MQSFKFDKSTFEQHVEYALRMTGRKKTGFEYYQAILYRNVNHDKILSKKNLPQAIIKYIQSYLCGKYFVDYNINFTSSEYSINSYYADTITFMTVHVPCKCVVDTDKKINIMMCIKLAQFRNKESLTKIYPQKQSPLVCNYSVHEEGYMEMNHSAHNHMCFVSFFTLLTESILKKITEKYSDFSKPFIN